MPELREPLVVPLEGLKARPSKTPRLQPAFHVLVVGIIGYLGAMMLNADSLRAMADRLPFGHERDVLVALAKPDQSLSHALYLDRPGREIRSIREQMHGHQKAVVVAEAPTTTTTTSTTVARTSTTLAVATTPPPPSTVAAGTTASPPPATTAATVPPTSLRIPTNDHPLRIWVGGDSLAIGLGNSLARIAGSQPSLSSTSAARISTGLTRPDYFDWPTEIARVVHDERPEVMVVMFGANDPQAIKIGDNVYRIDSAEWQTEYRRRVALVMDTVAPTRPLIWVGQPAMRSDDFDSKMQILNSIFSDEATKHPGVTYIDSRAIFGATYSAYLGDGSSAVKVRAGDGIHFNNAGYDRLASAVAAEINRQLTPPPPPPTTTTTTVAPTTTVAATTTVATTTTVAPTTTVPPSTTAPPPPVTPPPA